MQIPAGNGLFIWILDRVAGGDPVKQAIAIRAAGMSWVAIKIADGTNPVNADSRGNSLLGPAVKALREQGINVYGWHYVYGVNPVQEAIVAEKQMKTFGLDGYIINAEVEYKNKPTQAGILMSNLRYRMPGVSLGICTYRFPSYHREFPWAQFASCDFNMPQVYWIQSHDPGAQLQKTAYDYAQIGYKMPMIPIGAAFSESGWSPSVAELVEFSQKAGAMKLPAYGWWEFLPAFKNSEWWKAISTADRFKIFLPVVTNGNVPVKTIMTKYVDLRIRSGPSLNASVLGYAKPNYPYLIEKEEGLWGKIADANEQWVHMGYTIAVTSEGVG